MNPRKKGRTLDAAAVKSAATGRWIEILAAAGIAADLLDGKGHPCPKCGGDDRFAAHTDIAERGAVICRTCLAKGCGDGLAAVAWIRGTDFADAVQWVGEFLRIGTTHTDSQKPDIVARYNYRDAQGELRYQVVRYEPKDFRQRQPKPGGGWIWGTKGTEPLPYRLPEMLAEPTRWVVVAEGEKDCDNLARIGVLATCNHGGAGKWTATHATHLAGRRVVVLPDNDDAGEKHAKQVAASLQGIAEWVRVVRLPNLPPKGDVSDWIAAGGTKDELGKLTADTPVWTPADDVVQPTPTGPEPWPELNPLTESTLPEFPLQALPGILQDWTAAESHATQTPADLAALLALAVHSSAIARHVDIEPQPGWREPVNLFVAVLLEPGNRKSAVFSDATKPLRQAEAELIEAARPAVAREQSERRRAVKRLEKLEKLAAEKGDVNAIHDAGELAERLADWSDPVLPRLIVDDATNEKLGMVLAEQGGRIASMSPEGGVFDLMAGLYSKSGMPQFGVYLMGHAGDDLRTDRVSRKALHVERPALTCAYAMQPQVIDGLAGNVAFRGRGLLGRFLYAAPASWIGKREISPAPVSAAVADAYAARVLELAINPPQGTLFLHGDAARQFHDWQAEVEAMLADGGDLESIRDWGGKLAGATARLAAVLHCAMHPNAMQRGIESATIRAAIEIGRYLIPHAEAVLQMMQAHDDTTADDARYVLQWIIRHGRRDFTKREAQQHGKRRFPKADDIDLALVELTRRGYIRPKPHDADGPGRPPSPAYEVNPSFVVCEAKERTQYSQKPAQATNSENIEDASRHSETSNRVQVTV